MTTIIKNGTIVTADLTYKADVRFDNCVIAEIVPNLSGGTDLDATGCYVMPGGIDPHTHLEIPSMGTYTTDDFESGSQRYHHDGGGFGAAPTVMVMCPCVGGLSHNEAEEISPEWAAAGTDVLLHAVLAVAGVVS